ncbi:MAG: STAS domain-containing protein [Acidobacteriota bacterium]
MEDTAKRARIRRSRTRQPEETGAARLHASRAGEWMEASAIRAWALEQFQSSGERTRALVLDLEGIDHLDASALQVLLAIGVEQRRRGGHLHLEQVSAGLRSWFGFAGATELLGLAETGEEAAATEGHRDA